MAVEWIPIETCLPRKREVLVIASRTQKSRHEVIGLLIEFWAWASHETADGEIGGATVDTLASLIGADSDFWRVVIAAGWLVEIEDGLRIPNAESWITAGAKARLQKRARQERYRASGARSATDASTGAPPKRNRNGKKRSSSSPHTPHESNGASPVEIPTELNTPAFHAAWEEYLAYRTNELKKTFGQSSQRKQLESLVPLGPTAAITAINTSIANGWQGIFPPKESNGAPRRKTRNRNPGSGELYNPKAGEDPL